MRIERAPSLPERVVDRLRQMVRDGGLRWGDRLPSEDELARLFGVSRSSVREAIRVLEFLGIVEVNHGRGMFLSANPYRLALEPVRWSPLTDADLYAQALEVRLALEPAMARLAAERASDDTIARMERAITLSLEAARAGRAPNPEASIDFHQAIAEASGNLLLQMLFQAMHTLVADLVHRLKRAPEDRVWRLSRHQNLLDAIRSHDPNAAERAMRVHLEDLRRILEALEQNGQRSAECVVRGAEEDHRTTH